MVISKLKPVAIVLVILTIPSIGVLVMMIFDLKNILDNSAPLIFKVLYALSILFFLSFLILGELRNKAIKIELQQDYISKRNFLGFGLKEKYLYSDLDGFKIGEVHSRSRFYECIYLTKDGRKVVNISEFYQENYRELKAILMQKRLSYLGKEFVGFISETKDIFTF